ncbi:methionine aminopeptidase [Parastagonospora nodorum]|nr:methionine aminopeptidase [Parastagonospora nodorum]KAH4172534.1 methionine aminopeptidase [Parastagonospora nodorum]KAH4852171.1 methionine aminopeptidase [Parastagonospora nodorum]KAH4989554.1 methionine aminopeptidase [Parastagonospora nodorum]KAH5491024.1 methionine aminopeptidase [Parastagonospora nodorum]
MGSKTPEGHGQGPDGSSSNTAINCSNPPKSAAASGLVHVALEGQGEDSDDDDEQIRLHLNGSGANGTKKKRKRTKKKSKKASETKQSIPPRIALDDIFNGRPYPEGEITEYTTKDDNLQRTTAEEIRHLSAVANMDDEFLHDYRKAAEVHRQVRQHIQIIAKPGISLSTLALEIDNAVRSLTGHPGLEKGDALKAGIAFPTGLCLNNIGAHWTPNAGGKEVYFQENDVLKIDFGVHVSGRIVDSAFTIASNPVYDPLLAAVRAATNTGLRLAGPDARISHISAEMQEVMESYEVDIHGKTIPVKAVRNITGHNILRYKIHGDKHVPFIASKTSQRMEEGDIFAIETFGSTGKAVLRDGSGVYGYGRKEGGSVAGVHHASAKSLLRTIDENFGTLVFARRQLERLPGVEKWHLGMKTLVQAGVVESYAPLVDVEGSYVAQFEHTVLLRPNCKEVVSRGDDY